jgi:peptidoglycan hydrolase-like protein with peptidoglycan-binding domain
MMKGWELGLDPLDALANIFVVHGRVGFYAEFQRRRVIQAGHSFRIVESTASRCVVEGTRKDTGETHKAVFTAEQARQAKIDIQAYPAEKLVARATSRLVKQAFPDVLSGSLIVEDLLDGVITTDVDPVTAPAVQRRRQPRKVIAQPAAPPPPADVDDLLGDVQPVAEEMRPDVAEPDQGDLLDDDPDPPITSPQLQKLSILRKREGYADDEKGRADWFAWIELQINRVVSTNKDLTKAEATVLIDVLENPGAEDNPA